MAHLDLSYLEEDPRRGTIKASSGSIAAFANIVIDTSLTITYHFSSIRLLS